MCGRGGYNDTDFLRPAGVLPDGIGVLMITEHDVARARSPREITEEWEERMLATAAMRSACSRGRQRADAPCPFRTAFQRDRDRILHAKSFRRLAGKTQVFVPPFRSDHDRTRLTHTLEVCQVARTIARALRLNEDLVEAIALGHDLGHSPFGHTGEDALDAVYHAYDPTAHFRHNEHSLRVVDLLERDGRGLNLTWEVRDGILRHSKGAADWPCDEAAATLEGQLVALCDRIAYSSHDIDDALRAGLLHADDLPANIVSRLGVTHSARLTAMVGDVISASGSLLAIRMSPAMTELTNQLKDFMYENLYLSRAMAPRVRAHVRRVVTELFHDGMAHPDTVPGGAEVETTAQRARLVCDHIAGMTDQFAEKQYRRLRRSPRDK